MHWYKVQLENEMFILLDYDYCPNTSVPVSLSLLHLVSCLSTLLLDILYSTRIGWVACHAHQ